MEELIQRIIDLEARATAIMIEAEEEKKQIFEQCHLEIPDMAKHIREMSDNKISQLKGRTQYESDDRIIRIYGDTAMKMRLMEEQAEREQEFWEQDIYNRITQVKG